MGEVVEGLLSKLKALTSNPSTVKRVISDKALYQAKRMS
jgi:hypothetical protein